MCDQTPLAEAGFFHVPSRGSPDNVKCFVCFKELEGWEEGDDPWQEHVDHNNDCQFIKVGKKESELDVGEMVNMLMCRRKNLARQECKKKIKDLRDDIEKTRNKLLIPLKNTNFDPTK